MSRRSRRAVLLAVIIYILINTLAWGFMKAYVNSYNAVNNEKMAMARINGSEEGVEICVMGNSFCIPAEKKDADSKESAFRTFIPFKIRAVTEIFRQTGRKAAKELHQANLCGSC